MITKIKKRKRNIMCTRGYTWQRKTSQEQHNNVITVIIETREEVMLVRCITRVVKETKYIFSL